MLIRVENVSFSYENSFKVLQDVSLSIAEGERIALLGHNGSGKTTLVKHLNGLLQPDSGKVLISGRDIAKVKTADLASQVALLFQNPDDQTCKRTVWDEVVFGPKNLGYDRKTRDTLAEKALAAFDLLPLRNSNPHDSGYSVRKRIALASIVAMDTRVLVFDEPTAGLDPYEISLLKAVLAELESRNKTVVIITHDMDFVAETIERAIGMAKGRKVFDGKVRELFPQADLVAQCGLFLPQIFRLSAALSMHTCSFSPAEFVAAFQEQHAAACHDPEKILLAQASHGAAPG